MIYFTIYVVVMSYKCNRDGVKTAMVHLRVPSWLDERIKARAEAVGETPSVEMRRALIESFGKKNDEHQEPGRSP
jgi:hypothetical protein